jgi:hypothetical protein
MLQIFLEVGPVQKEVNFPRSKLVAELRNALGTPSDRTVSDTYTRVVRRSTKVNGENIDSLVDAMGKLWNDFGGSEKLKRVDDIVKKITR